MTFALPFHPGHPIPESNPRRALVRLVRHTVVPLVIMTSLASAWALLAPATHTSTPSPAPAAASSSPPEPPGPQAGVELALLERRWHAEALRRARALAEARLARSFSVPSDHAPADGADQVARELAFFQARRRMLDEQLAWLEAHRRDAHTAGAEATKTAHAAKLETRMAALRSQYRRQAAAEADEASRRLAEIGRQLRRLQAGAGQDHG
jgi:hypothetical protein